MHGSAVAIGTFDGLHRGHQYLIRKLILTARRFHARCLVVALDRPVKPVEGILTTPEEKCALLRRFPLDGIVMLPVTPELIDESAEDFFRDVLEKELKVRHIVVGEHFALGRHREGTVHWLSRKGKADGVGITVVPRLCSHNGIISSSRVRTLLREGQLRDASALLGRDYGFEGIPVRGRAIGRTLGVPTVNLRVQRDKIMPPGVYVASAAAGRKLSPAVINIGRRPTFSDTGGEIVPEIHLLDFHGTWPQSRTTVTLLKHLRSEKKFASPEDLQKQMHHDIARAHRYFMKRGS